MNDEEVISIVLSKLDFTPKYKKVIKKNNTIIIKCHTYFINIFNDINIDDNKNEEEIKLKSIEYKQPSIFVNNNYITIINNANNENRKEELYICIKYADIIINLENKKYKIVNSNFNIRKPTNDKFNLFQKIIHNLNTHYFIINYDTMHINYHSSNFNINIYHINNINILFINGNDDNDKIIIDLLMKINTTISSDIYTKPLINNKIKITVIENSY